jgi:Uma2 family endonuclease
MASQQQPTCTPEEYLARERMAQEKHEFFDGHIYAMSGASRSHVRITANLIAALHGQLRSRGCDLFTGDMRVSVSQTGLYTYPDATVVCGQAQFADDAFDVLLNPTVVVEVLSPSTESYDRGRKFEHYMRLASLREYVLITQDRMRVERFTRAADGRGWVLSAAEGVEASLELPSIGCVLRLADLYERVELPPVTPLRAVYEDAPRPYAPVTA